MPYLIAAVIVVGVLCTVDLLLTLGVIRRLREHTELLSNRSSGVGGDPHDGIIAEGERPAAFEAADGDGRPVSVTSGEGPLLLGFFSTSCPPCRELAPDFAAQAARFPGGRDRVVVVVNGARDGAIPFLNTLSAVARVVVEDERGPVAAAFRVDGYPSWCVVDGEGVVTRSGVGMDRLPVAVAA
jgi:thiol-disulfide isomerase/thioredoxin